MKNNFLKNYAYSLILVSFILLGSFLGMTLGAKAVTFKPLGDIFLNLLFTIVVPLVFFSVSSAVANMKSLDRLGKILFWLVVIAVITGVIAACMMIIGVKIYPPGAGVNIDTSHIVRAEGSRVSDQLMRAFTVTDFVDLLSKKNMLVLIFLSLLVGLAASTSGEKGRPFVHFLISGNEVMCKLIKYIMLYAPIGLGAYFAYLVGKFGAELMGTYFRVIVLYYPVAILYFFLGHTFYVYLAGG
ncbi:MAG TPA: cation:dicarboxylase symporter family transporter, partial [Candidatus Omnitrophota bacterium]|nr:cation:dicarboxylase symporter family transporter [Candidatus Omnitrophota bacterium]